MDELERLQEIKTIDERERSIVEEEDISRNMGFEDYRRTNEIDVENLHLIKDKIPLNTLSSLFPPPPFMPVNGINLDNILNSMDKSRLFDRVNSKPFLIITAGTVASGKSNFKRNTIDKTIEKTSVKGSGLLVEISIDELIENEQQYKNEIQNIINNYELYLKKNNATGQPGRINPDTRHLLKDERVLNEFNDAYFSAKKRVVSNREDILNESIRNRNNILIETTGKKIPFKYLTKVKDYNIIFAYVLVENQETRTKIETRANNKILSFCRGLEQEKEDKKKGLPPKKNPAPRLPNTIMSNVVDINKDMLMVLNDLRNSVCNCKKYEEYDDTVTEIPKEYLYDSDNNDIEPWDLCQSISKYNNNITLLIYNNDDRLPSPLLVYDHSKDYHYDELTFNTIVNGVLYPEARRNVNRVNRKTLRRVSLPKRGGKKNKRTHKKKNKKKSKKNLKKLKVKNKSKKRK